MIVPDSLHAAARLHAHRPMAICGVKTRTYAEIEAEAKAFFHDATQSVTPPPTFASRQSRRD